MRNTSIGSKNFWVCCGGGWGALVLLKGNNIYDAQNDTSIETNSSGCETLLDNTIKTRSGDWGPSLQLNATENILVGNTFNINNPVSQASETRLRQLDTTIDPELITPTSVALPPTPPNNNRTIYDVQTGTGNDAQAIQMAINLAVAAGNRAVVHIPCGFYNIAQTLTVPANAEIQLIGDGGSAGYQIGSMLNWSGSGSGPILDLQGPNRAILRDFSLFGGNGLLVEDPDQGDGLIYGEELDSGGQSPSCPASTNIYVNGIENNDVNLLGSGVGASAQQNIEVVGGPNESQGIATNGQVSVMCASGSTSNLFYNVTDGGQLLVETIYQEVSNTAIDQILNLTGQGELSVALGKFAGDCANTTPTYAVNGMDGGLTLTELQFLDLRL